MTDRIASLYGEEHDKEAVWTTPELFARYWGVFRETERAAAVAALAGHEPGRWPEIIKPYAAPLPSIPVQAPGVLLSATPLGEPSRPPPESMRLVANSDGWHTRSVLLCKILQQQAERLEGRPPHDWAAHFNALSLQWTSCIELLELEPVQSLQHAIVLYACIHEDWNTAALQWLETVAFTWWPLWRDRHPEIRPLLELKAGWGFPSPRWLLGRADA